MNLTNGCKGLVLVAWICSSFPAAAQTARVVLKKPTAAGCQEAVFLLGPKDRYAIGSLMGEHCMGMPGPVATGWYCYGFLNITVNGQEAGKTAVSSMLEAEQGRRAILDSVWHLDAADVRVRYLGLPGRDFLFCELTLAPRQEIKTCAVAMTCFPAYFTGAYGQREQARFIQTPAQLIREAEGRTNLQLDPKDNGWLLYGDDYFDVAKTRESDGPCAMLVLPEEVAAITIPGLSYGITTSLVIAPATRKVRLAFWKMKGWTNAEAAHYFMTNGATLRQELAALDFMPAPVKTIDLAKITADIERVVQATTVGTEFQKKAAEILAGIKADSADLTAPGDSIGATERKLQLLDTYGSFIYEARLAEILASLDKD